MLEWSTGCLVRSGAARYVHLIRSPDDPTDVSARGGKVGRTEQNQKLSLFTVQEWKRAAMTLLESVPSPITFNAICLRLCSRTADIMFETDLDEAVWSLVSDGKIEHTMSAPILFRVRR